MLNLNRVLKLMACFVLIAAFMGCAATPKHQSTGAYIDDTVITTKVKAAIFNEPTLKALQINVKSYNGVVQLSGFVDSKESITKAGEVAGRVENVTRVQNDLVLKP